ncbi:sulfatase domain protein [Xylariales sp. PMI_506]|nr:sulfatase domain protein [Xylariales sp. PMI_506]
MISTRPFGRLVPFFPNQRFIFTLFAVAILCSKLFRFYARTRASPLLDVILWAPYFFLQDVSLLILTRLIASKLCTVRGAPSVYNVLARTAMVVAGVVVVCMAVGSITFFLVTGAEIHWLNLLLVSDPSAAKMVVESGVRLFISLLTMMSLFSWLVQDICHNGFGAVLNIIYQYSAYILRCLGYVFHALSTRWRNYHSYSRISLKDEAAEESWDSSIDAPVGGLHELATTFPGKKVPIGVGLLFLSQIFLAIFHPYRPSVSSLAWTLPLMPIRELLQSGSNFPNMPSFITTLLDESMDTGTALSQPPEFPWLPSDYTLPGFQDWYTQGAQHYRASADPIRVSNLNEEVYSELRTALKDINIKHVMVVMLESTRYDVFPFKKNDYIYERLADSFKDKKLPKDLDEHLSTLTPTTNFITGDYDDGFEHQETPRRGGIRFTNAFTAGTYTLKSKIGTMCGSGALIAYYNREFDSHFYQPCLPHIFNAFNSLEKTEGASEKDFRSFKWTSHFMQSITEGFDKTKELLQAIGFGNGGEIVTKEFLQSRGVEVPDINYFGMPEYVIKDYLRAAFSDATAKDERVFLTHITSTTHHPFEVPEEEDKKDDIWLRYHDESNAAGHGDLWKYVRTVGYVDGWLQQILDLLEEQGVANETLIAFVGDHGLALAEQNAGTCYENNNIASFHVPLVLSHPGLPPMTINEPVSSMQILPTIMDILRESDSLSDSQSQAASDLAHNYEGQSLIRHPVHESPEGEDRQLSHGNWHFTIMNPGTSSIALRDARKPHWHLIVPLQKDISWYFANWEKDPHGANPVQTGDYDAFLTLLESEESIEAVRWAEEAVRVAVWWAGDNHRRWKYQG